MNMQKDRILYLDVLNVLACLCVIFMHCNGIVHNFTPTRQWRESMVVETLAYWAVPVFFMISGATLMEYRNKYSTKIYFKKRIVKTLIPFIIWTLLSLIFKLYTGFITVEFNISNIINMFTNTTVESVYWFFIPLFMVYLSFPVISLLKDNIKILWYMVACAFVIYSLYPTLSTIFLLPQNGNFIFPVAGGYLMFSLLGYLLSKTRLSNREKIIIYTLGIFGVAVRYISTVVWSEESGVLNETFWGYLNFPSVFLAVAVFTVIKSVPWKKLLANELLKKIVLLLSSASYGVYLLHMIVYRSLLLYTGINESSYRWRFLVPFVIYGISVVLIIGIKKIPVLKKIVP